MVIKKLFFVPSFLSASYDEPEYDLPSSSRCIARHVLTFASALGAPGGTSSVRCFMTGRTRERGTPTVPMRRDTEGAVQEDGAHKAHVKDEST